jgi:hypothetical protein
MANGLSPYHPGEWDEAGMAAFLAAQVAEVQAAWSHPGRWALHGARAAEVYANELRDAQTKPPFSLYRVCPCHPHGYRRGQNERLEPWERIDLDDVLRWVLANRASRDHLSQRTAACLAWLEQDFGRRVPEPVA